MAHKILRQIEIDTSVAGPTEKINISANIICIKSKLGTPVNFSFRLWLDDDKQASDWITGLQTINLKSKKLIEYIEITWVGTVATGMVVTLGMNEDIEDMLIVL